MTTDLSEQYDCVRIQDVIQASDNPKHRMNALYRQEVLANSLTMGMGKMREYAGIAGRVHADVARKLALIRFEIDRLIGDE